MEQGVWAWILLGLLAGAGLETAKAGHVSVVGNGYEGLVVGISPQLDESQGPAIISALKDMIREGSNYLYEATEQRLFIREAKILIPKSWKNILPDQEATTQTFQDSDIRVDIPNPAYKTQPYTEHMGGCGKPGRYIHLTPEYFTDDVHVRWWGPRGKFLVPLWAKLRWGVFEEIGYPGDPMYPYFHKEERGDTVTGILHNHCANEAVYGELRDHLNQGPCQYDPATTMPNINCRFYPFPVQQASSSLMVHPAIPSDSIIHFCNASTHNKGSPTKQAFYCRKSVWEVMNQHSDLQRAGIAKSGLPAGGPLVTVVQQTDANYVLVLDYSGSMSTHGRIEKLQRHAKRYVVYDVPENASVAVVRFSSGATTVVPLTRLTDRRAREDVASKILTDNNGGTSIGSGILEALKILKTTINNNIVVITDGQENESPTLADVTQQVVQADVCVNTVAFGDQADQQLETLAKLTGCMTDTVQDKDSNNMLANAFQRSVTHQYSAELKYLDIQIFDSQTIKTSDVRRGEYFILDDALGRQLTLRLETDDQHHITSPPRLIHPDGSVTTAATSDFDSLALVWTLVVPLAEPGRWRWEVDLSSNINNYIKAVVTARQRDPSNNNFPIVTRVMHSAPPVGANPLSDPIRIFAEVKKGNSPVIGADVVAIVTQPDNANAPPFSIPLKDNGFFADSMKNDGMYSGYLTNFTSVGRYSLRAEVAGTSSTMVSSGRNTSPPAGRRRRRSAAAPGDLDKPLLCCGSVMPFDSSTATPSGSFTRVSSGGSIKVTEVPASGEDLFPPARVGDLKVVSVDTYINETNKHSINLTWTTPGDDFDQGTVSNYVFRLSDDGEIFGEAEFSNAPPDTLLPVTKTQLEEAGVLQAAGTKVAFSIMYQGRLSFHSPKYLALQAVDDSNNLSEVSNVFKFTLAEKMKLPEKLTNTVRFLTGTNTQFQKERGRK